MLDEADDKTNLQNHSFINGTFHTLAFYNLRQRSLVRGVTSGCVLCFWGYGMLLCQSRGGGKGKDFKRVSFGFMERTSSRMKTALHMIRALYEAKTTLSKSLP